MTSANRDNFTSSFKIRVTCISFFSPISCVRTFIMIWERSDMRDYMKLWLIKEKTTGK